jgi:hypothetical protein
MVRPLLKPYARLRIVAALVVDRADRAVHAVEDAVLHDARAAELREPRGDRAAKVIHGPRHFYRVLRWPVPVALPRVVLGIARCFLLDMAALLPPPIGAIVFDDARQRNRAGGRGGPVGPFLLCGTMAAAATGWRNGR